MPNIRSAKKKLRKDTKKTKHNLAYKNKLKKTVKDVSKMKGKDSSADVLKKAYSAIDKAAKKKSIHKNKAARLKSRISKLLFGKK